MIYLRVETRQPLCIASEPAQGFIRQSLPYIPGSALRGALAAQLRARQPDISQDDFNRYILHDACRFSNLYPLPLGFTQSHPLPRTAHSCKHYSGFRENPANPSKEYHGVRDTLMENLRFVATRGTGQPHVPEGKCQGAGCVLPLEPFDGFYTGDDSSEYVRHEVETRSVTQTAIDPNRETARPANLFSVEALEEEQIFAGYIALASEADEETFCRAICRPEDELRIGYGRTRGMGLVRVIDCEPEEPDFWEDDLADRLTRFNERAPDAAVPADKSLFSLTLHSDMILQDPFFRYQSQIDGPTLAREVDARLGSTRLLATFASTRRVAGWSTPHGLPLPVAHAITMGSTFIFATPLPQNELVAALSGLEQRGMGERTTEGFGQVVVCHPFHREVTQI